MYQDFMKILAALKYWNISLDDPSFQNNFQSRKILQKITFISQTLGINMKYSFSLYKHGPYCSTLTDDYYYYHDNVPKMSTSYKLNKNEKIIFDNMDRDILSHSIYEKNTVEFLEAIATIMYFKKNDMALMDDELFEKTKASKPFISDRIITIAINTVKQVMFKPEYLTKEIQDEIDMWDKADD